MIMRIDDIQPSIAVIGTSFILNGILKGLFLYGCFFLIIIAIGLP